MSELITRNDSSGKNSVKRGRRALWLAVGAAVIWLMIGSWAGPLAGSLSEVQENDSATFLPASSESTVVSEEQALFADNPSIPILTVITHPDGSALTDADRGPITEFLTGVPVLTLADGSRVATYLDSEQLLPLPSEDGKALLVNISVNGDLGGERTEAGEFVFIEITNLIRDYAATFDTLQINVTGPGGFLADLIKVFGAIDGALLLATAIVVAIILIFVYRSPVLWLIPLVSAGFALAVSSGIVYVLADNDVLVLNGQSQGILTVLVFGAGTDYSLLLVSRYREELHKYAVHTDAIGAAIKGVRAPIIASAATTSIGLMCLLQLERPTAWPEYGSYLKIELIREEDEGEDLAAVATMEQRKAKYWVRFSLNGQILKSTWCSDENNEPLSMVRLNDLEEMIHLEHELLTGEEEDSRLMFRWKNGQLTQH